VDAAPPHPATPLIIALLVLATAAWPLLHLGDEFLPRFDEGELLCMLVGAGQFVGQLADHVAR
jgi:Cu(I)/Ag(I) efflux system membrane protein CusA/SilA